MGKPITFTKEEATALVQLIDIAIKSGGLNVAAAALTIAVKIENAFKEEVQEAPEADSDKG